MGNRASPFAVLIVALAAMTGSLPAESEDWYERYRRGEEAIKRQNWRETIEQTMLAIEKREEPAVGLQLGSGVNVNYLPYLQLGIAYYNTGQYRAAIEAFDVEQQFGSVTASWSDVRNLRTFRQLATDALDAARGSEENRVEALIARALADAEKLEWQGRLDEAMSVVGRAMGADPENELVRARMQRLREQVTTQERRREALLRLDQLIHEGDRLAAEGAHEEASTRYRQALAIEARPEIRQRLEGSQKQLRDQIERQRNLAERRKTVDDGLSAAARLEQEEQLDAALRALEPVLALEPDNPEALRVHKRLLEARQLDADRLSTRTQIDELLSRSVGLFDEARYDEVVATLNLVLALDADNTVARAFLEQAFEALHAGNAKERGRPVLPKIPPVIVLNNSANVEARDDAVDVGGGSATAEESRVERVDSGGVVLAGMVVDDRPEVEVAFLSRLGRDSQVPFAAVARQRLVGVALGEAGLYRFAFSRAFPVRVGTSTWKVLATDSDGLSSEVIHPVLYVRPWSSGPWSWGVLLGLGGALAAGLAWSRARRRRKLLARRFNPYIAGAPVLNDDLFFGRRRLMTRVLQSVHNNSLLLYGERRIGKTSFQHHLKRRLVELDDPEYRFFPVYIDLQGTPQERFFAHLGEEISDGLQPTLQDDRPRSDFGPDYGYRDLVRDIRHALERLRQLSDRQVKLVLLIDEVDELNDYDPKINQRLRSLFMKSFAEDLVAVVTGVKINKHWASEGSPWYNFFEEIEVRPFSRDDAEALIRRPVQGVFQLEQEAVEQILDRTGHKPYLIQKLCVELVDRMHQTNSRRITVADVDAVNAAVEP